MADRNSSPLTVDALRAALHSDPDTGVFTRLSCADVSHIGDLPNGLDSWGYIRFRVLGRKYRAHRLAWFYCFGEWPVNQIDHKDQDKTNNRIGNLRDASQQSNQQNRTVARADSRSGLQGVCRNGDYGFVAEIKVAKRRHYLGCFRTPEAAHEAYMKAKIALHDLA